MRKLAVVAFAAAVLIAPRAFALEPFAIYDTFGSPPIDPSRWSETERVRTIRMGKLQLLQRTHGPGGADAGSSFVNWNDNLSNPSAVTAVRARITVDALEVNACPANPALAQSRARIVGSFFNVGTPTPGSQEGDAIAQVRIGRLSNSADPAGVLRVQGLLSVCTSADCNAGSIVGNIVELGTVAVGQATNVQMQWDPAAKTFLFSRDGGAFAGSVAYPHDDASPPGIAFKQLSTRLDLPSCMSAPRVTGLVDASFDNVLVNVSAAP